MSSAERLMEPVKTSKRGQEVDCEDHDDDNADEFRWGPVIDAAPFAGHRISSTKRTRTRMLYIPQLLAYAVPTA